jgi:GcrA cell cycle regulator
MKWTEEMLTTLDQMWLAGDKVAVIAPVLGVTPNAVIGKARRRDLPRRPSPIKSDDPEIMKRREATRIANTIKRQAEREERERALALKVARKPPEKPVMAPPVAKPAPVFRPPRLTACSWPIGEPKSGEFRFCSEQTVPGKPYCLDHCKLAYVRRDKRELV